MPQRKNFPTCGRLVALENLGGKSLQNFLNADSGLSGFEAINFPAMPDSIDLARKTEYVVETPRGFPDGAVHAYVGTGLLEIPFSFKLHAFDEYCTKGPKTILEVAALLHAFVLPFGPVNGTVTYNVAAERKAQKQGDSAAVAQEAGGKAGIYNQAEGIYPPPTCLLELIKTEPNSVGVSCIGYVKEVDVKLFGPFLQGPPGSQNLPTSGEFSFVFVHHPGHGNNFLTSVGYTFKEQQAYTQIVKSNLYNTMHLMTSSNATYKGYNSTEISEPALPDAPSESEAEKDKKAAALSRGIDIRSAGPTPYVPPNASFNAYTLFVSPTRK